MKGPIMIEPLTKRGTIRLTFRDACDRKSCFSKITSPLGSIDMNKIEAEPKLRDSESTKAWRMAHWGCPRQFISFVVRGRYADIDCPDCDLLLIALQLMHVRANKSCDATILLENGHDAFIEIDGYGRIHWRYDKSYGASDFNENTDVCDLAKSIRSQTTE